MLKEKIISFSEYQVPLNCIYTVTNLKSGVLFRNIKFGGVNGQSEITNSNVTLNFVHDVNDVSKLKYSMHNVEN